jgi:DNA repair photolyase
MRRFTGHTEKWGDFLDIKINAPEVLEKQLSSHKIKRGVVLLGSVTDVYQPAERKYRITRSILEILLKYNFPISILTKSDLVLRDIDLLKQFKDCEVGLTITTLDEAITKDFEPYSSLPEKRLGTLKILKKNGIKTYCFIGPVLPGFTNLKLIFARLQGKINFVMIESLNTRRGNWKDITAFIGKKCPQFLSLYQNLDRQYWDKIKREAQTLSKEYKIPLKGFYTH